MLIVLDNETLFRNISNDGKQGSGAGDIILHQHANAPRPNEYQLTDFDCIPDHAVYHADPSLLSKKRTAINEVCKVFVFDKFQVNDEPIECENKFIVFIRKSGNDPKTRLVCQGEDRKIVGTDIDNKQVMDTVSKHLDGVAFTVQALEYKEDEDILNFIVFTYGKSNQASEIFKKNEGIQRVLAGYGSLDYRDWSDIEFSIHCIQLIRKYKINILAKLLADEMYCRKRFNMEVPFISLDNAGERIEQAINIDNVKYYVLAQMSKTSKRNLWEFLLDRIESVSEDVVINSDEYQLKGLKIPDAVPIDVEAETLEILFRVGTTNYRSYFYKQKVFQGDKVLLVSDAVDAIKTKYLYKVRFVKEESIICDKCEIMINPAFESEVLDEIRGELL